MQGLRFKLGTGDTWGPHPRGWRQALNPKNLILCTPILEAGINPKPITLSPHLFHDAGINLGPARNQSLHPAACLLKACRWRRVGWGNKRHARSAACLLKAWEEGGEGRGERNFHLPRPASSLGEKGGGESKWVFVECM